MSGWIHTAMQTLLYCLTLFSDFESSNSLVRVAAVPQFAPMYLEMQTRTTMTLWKVKRKLLVLSFCFENLEQKRKKEIKFMYVNSKCFCFEILEQKQQNENNVSEQVI